MEEENQTPDHEIEINYSELLKNSYRLLQQSPGLISLIDLNTAIYSMARSTSLIATLVFKNNKQAKIFFAFLSYSILEIHQKCCIKAKSRIEFSSPSGSSFGTQIINACFDLKEYIPNIKPDILKTKTAVDEKKCILLADIFPPAKPAPKKITNFNSYLIKIDMDFSRLSSYFKHLEMINNIQLTSPIEINPGQYLIHYEDWLRLHYYYLSEKELETVNEKLFLFEKIRFACKFLTAINFFIDDGVVCLNTNKFISVNYDLKILLKGLEQLDISIACIIEKVDDTLMIKLLDFLKIRALSSENWRTMLEINAAFQKLSTDAGGNKNCEPMDFICTSSEKIKIARTLINEIKNFYGEKVYNDFINYKILIFEKLLDKNLDHWRLSLGFALIKSLNKIQAFISHQYNFINALLEKESGKNFSNEFSSPTTTVDTPYHEQQVSTPPLEIPIDDNSQKIITDLDELLKMVNDATEEAWDQSKAFYVP